MVITLRKLCLQTIANEVVGFSSSRDGDVSWSSASLNSLQPSWIPIPRSLSQEIFDFCMNHTVAEEANNVMKLFLQKPSQTPLEHLCLQNNRRADVNLIVELTKANLSTLTHVDIRGCRTIPTEFWQLLNSAPNLCSLKTTQLQQQLQCPKLRFLFVDWKPKKAVQRIQGHFQANYYDKLIEHVLPNLTHLDLSWCPWSKKLKTLGNGKSLKVLILRNCDISTLKDSITQLTELRVLDVSVCIENESIGTIFNGNYSDPENLLANIVTSLPNLESLNVSGTNLGTVKDESSKDASLFDLESITGKSITLFEFPQTVREDERKSKDRFLAAIRRHSDTPKTLRYQLLKVRSERGISPQDVNELLSIQTRMLKNVRLTMYFRHWALKCAYNFLDDLENPCELVSKDVRHELFLVLNRLIHSHSDSTKTPEILLGFIFQIFVKLLPEKECEMDAGTSKEMMRLGKFLLTLDTMKFVYLKTETLLFRMLHRMSLEKNVCSYLSKNRAIESCCNFFKSIQMYIGFNLTIRQTSVILPLVWKSILNFVSATNEAKRDFIQNKGLTWMNSHLNWCVHFRETQRELCITFMEILAKLEKQAAECQEFRWYVIANSSKDLLNRLRGSVARILVTMN